MTIGDKIQKRRKELGLTQEELAKKADLAYTTLIKIEGSQVKNPTIKTMQKIADALEITIDNLIDNN